MGYWLLKSDPDTYGWAEMARDGRTNWSGVRNYQASNNLKAMKKGDQALFYHSGGETAVVGLVEVVKEYYPDPSDAAGRFGMVDVRAAGAFKAPVTLAQIKAEPRLKDLALLRQSRLSVVPIDDQSWKLIRAMGGGKA
ncbi:MAG: EVE domain-containing protein [Dongiaceae bacterium]